MHPQDALLSGVKEGELVQVSSKWGTMVARVQHGGGIARGTIFVPIHWNNQTASDARVGALVNPVVDPISGEPEFKHTPARVSSFPVSWHGFILTRTDAMLDDVTYWTRIQGQLFVRYELAGRMNIADPDEWAKKVLHAESDDSDWLEYQDASLGIYRAVHVVNDRIKACIFMSPRPDLPSRSWLASLFMKDVLEDRDRVGVLLGRSLKREADAGPTVCSCFGVGRNTICNVITKQGLTSVSAITACLKAGGNCGSCVPELKKLLAEILTTEVD